MAAEASALVKSLSQELVHQRFAWQVELPPLPSAKGAGGAFFWGWGGGLYLGWVFLHFTASPKSAAYALYLTVTCCLHRRPQTCHPGCEDNQPLLGRICMSSPSHQSVASWGRRRLCWHELRSALPWELTSRCFLGQTVGGWVV